MTAFGRHVPHVNIAFIGKFFVNCDTAHGCNTHIMQSGEIKKYMGRAPGNFDPIWLIYSSCQLPSLVKLFVLQSLSACKHGLQMHVKLPFLMEMVSSDLEFEGLPIRIWL